MTQEIKAQFFAQYWGQNIMTADSHNDVPYPVYADNMFEIKEDYLLLRDLKDITDEDAIEVAKLVYYRTEDHTKDDGKEIVQYLIDNNNDHIPPLKFIEIYQYLQSKGYALPFLEYSAEQLIEMGWIKIKTN